MLMKIVIALVVLVLLGVGFFKFRAMTSVDKSVAGGIVEEQLAPCPGTPNCVSSQTQVAEKQVAPFKVSAGSNGPESWQKLVAVIEKTKGAQIESNNGSYLHATFKTPLMGYIDDLELLADFDQQEIHVRSASRVGHSDMGANRKRVEALRAAYQSQY